MKMGIIKAVRMITICIVVLFTFLFIEHHFGERRVVNQSQRTIHLVGDFKTRNVDRRVTRNEAYYSFKVDYDTEESFTEQLKLLHEDPLFTYHEQIEKTSLSASLKKAINYQNSGLFEYIVENEDGTQVTYHIVIIEPNQLVIYIT